MKVSINKRKRVIPPEELGDCEIRCMPSNTWGHIVYSTYDIFRVGKIVYSSGGTPRIITAVDNGGYWRADERDDGIIVRVKLLNVEEVVLIVAEEK